MKKPTLSAAKRWLMIGAIAVVGLCRPALAGLQIPYTNDVSTLHLWHLDETSGNTMADSAGSLPLTNLGLPVAPPFTNTFVGSPAFPGLGFCVTNQTKPHLLYGGSFTDVSQFCDTNTGAFTFEVLLNFGVNPLGTSDAEIICGDNGAGTANRGWQWRIINGVMEWNLLAGNTSDNDFKANLPATGPDAAIAGVWYHVAVTYTGNNPSNGDTPNILTFYWTLLDANRTAADVLKQFTATRPLSGAPAGNSTPNFGVGASGRIPSGATVGNGEGIIGSVDEVRVSKVARSASQMAFIVGGASNPPVFTQQPAANTLSGYGQTLTVPALVSGTPPLSYSWLLNGVTVPGQTDTTLIISNATFAQMGAYQLVVSNDYGMATSSNANVVIGAVPTGLVPTGLDATGNLSTGDIVDPNWTLWSSADPANLGPRLFVFENSNPITLVSGGNFSPFDGISQWSGIAGNLGGVAPGSPAGTYDFRSTFLIDQADPATMTLRGQLWVSSSITDIQVNGKSTGIALAPGVGLYAATFTITNGFVAGKNTLDFIENPTTTSVTALRVEISGVGQALPAGLPVITNQPISQSVRDGNVFPNNSQATFSVVALGRPPLTYQWSADGTTIPDATNRTLTFLNPTTGGQGTTFTVAVHNDSGTVVSQPATLSIVQVNQPPVPANISFVTYTSGSFSLPLSRIVQSATDADGDPITFSSVDPTSAQGSTVVQNPASLGYTPNAGFIGADQFNYVLFDGADQATGTVGILVLTPPTNNLVVAPGGTGTFNVGLSSNPTNFTFQWQFNGTNISGATNASLTIANAQLSDSGSYVLLATDRSGTVWPSPTGALTVGMAGIGTGLTGDYYTSITNGVTNFVGTPTLTRIDPSVNFDWSAAPPDPSITQTYFMVRWHGQVQPLFSEAYTFSTTSDDGSRLWVNGQLLADQWTAHGPATVGGTITLVAGQKYDIVMEYFQQTAGAVAKLNWSSAHQGLQVIPSTQLFPSATLQPALSAKLTGTNFTVNWAGTFTLQSSTNLTGPWTTVSDVVGPYTVPATGSKFFRLH